VKAYGVLGGTFDPVHIAHLRLAIEAVELCGLDHVRMIPCHIPPHRGPTLADPAQRLRMLQLACKTIPCCDVDDRELQRPGPSFMIDTLQSLHETFPDRAPCLIMGADAFHHLDSWRRWQSLLDYYHIIVAGRPGTNPVFNERIETLLKHHGTDDAVELQSRVHGRIYFITIEPLSISATAIRALRRDGRDIRLLVCDKVYEFIQHHQLYI